MLELMVCSMVTILPDYLYRRYVQGKRIGIEINLYTVWYELRWGITTCLVLTISLITMIFYFHPATTNVASLYRTVTILPEKGGRVAEVMVKLNDQVEAGQPLFKLDSTQEQAALETARSRVAEVDASLDRRQDRARRGGRPDPAGARRLPAGHRRVRNQGGTPAAECEYRLRTRGPEASGSHGGPEGRRRRGNRQQDDTAGEDQFASAGAEGERGIRPATGAGRARQDGRPRRRQGHGGAVHAPAGRRGQPDCCDPPDSSFLPMRATSWWPVSARSRRRS